MWGWVPGMVPGRVMGAHISPDEAHAALDPDRAASRDTTAEEVAVYTVTHAASTTTLREQTTSL